MKYEDRLNALLRRLGDANDEVAEIEAVTSLHNFLFDHSVRLANVIAAARTLLDALEVAGLGRHPEGRAELERALAALDKGKTA